MFQLKLIILSFWTKFTQKAQAVRVLQAFAFYVVNVNSSVVFKQFEDLKDLKGKIGYVLPPGLFLS